MGQENLLYNTLSINISKLTQDFIAYENDNKKISEFSHNDLINDWHIEHIRRFNIKAQYLIFSLDHMQSIANKLLNINSSKTDEVEYTSLIMLHRSACRDVCINIDVYIEGIKTFIRYYFFMDKNKTDNTKSFLSTLLEYKELTKWEYIDNFIKACETLHNDDDANFLKIIRDNEMHNSSPLELINYEFAEGILIPVAKDFVISNELLHNKIVNVIKVLENVCSLLQKLVEHISPFDINSFLETRNGTLKNILRLEERYKKENEYVKQFLILKD